MDKKEFDYSVIGRRIKSFRKKKGLSQQDLANILGKSLRTIQKYESGEIEVSIGLMYDLASVFNVPITELLGINPESSAASKSSPEEVKRDRFIRIAEQRTQKVLDSLYQLRKCSDTDSYRYSEKDVEKILGSIEGELQRVRDSFAGTNRFSLIEKDV